MYTICRSLFMSSGYYYAVLSLMFYVYFCFVVVATDFFTQSTIPSQSASGSRHRDSSWKSSSGYEWGDLRLPWVWQALIVLQCSASSSLMFKKTSNKFSEKKNKILSETNMQGHFGLLVP